MVTITDPATVPDATGPVGEAVMTCDLYLMDTNTKKILPNRRYRRIDPISGKSILGRSDAQGKISGSFAHAYVEVLPETGKTYLDGALTMAVTPTTPKNMGYVVEIRTDLLNPHTAATITSVTPALNIPAGVNHKYMSWLENRTGNVWSDYKRAAVDRWGDSSVTAISLDGAPSVPDGANLVDVNSLTQYFAANQAASSGEYQYLNTLRHSTVRSDAVPSNILENLIRDRRLPSQYYYVLGHGSPDRFAGYKADGRPISFRKSLPSDLRALASMMKDNGYDDKRTAVFLACNLGNEAGSFAEVFAALPDNGTVYAFTGMGFWPHSGTTFSCMATYTVTKTIPGTPPVTQQGTYSSNTVGHWRIFNTVTAAITDNPACTT